MARRRYFRAELQWVNGVCGECHRADQPVARVPRERVLTPAGNPIRRCARCLGKHRRLDKSREEV